MRRKKSNTKKLKGYTLIEILATIVILGILSALGIVTINHVVKQMHENHFKAQEKAILMATKSYSEDNKAILPKKIGEKVTVTIKELQKNKYLGKVLQYDKKECTVGYVTIFKYDKDLYTYRPYLKCPNFETNKKEYGGEGPQISIQTDNNIKNPTFSFTLVAEDKTNIIGYEYIVYKYGVETLNSGSVATSKTNKVEKKNIPLKDIAPGQFKILVKATNNYGVTNTKTAELKVIGTDGPICGEISPVIKTWHNNSPTTISVKCIDKGGSGCKQDVFTKSFIYNSKKNFIEIVDNNGKKTNCLVDTYLDNVAPDKPKIENKYHNKWINDNYNIYISSKDLISGIDHLEYKYGSGEWIKEPSLQEKYVEKYRFKVKVLKQNFNDFIYARVCDKAGNCSEESSTKIQIDIDKPILNFQTDPETIYKEKEGLNVISICNDNFSGIDDEKTKLKSYIKSPKKNKEIIHYCQDKAGNKTTIKDNFSVQSWQICETIYNRCSSCGCESYGGWVQTGSSVEGPTYSNPSTSGTTSKKECTWTGKHDPSGNMGDMYNCVSYSRSCATYYRCSSCGVDHYNYCWAF